MEEEVEEEELFDSFLFDPPTFESFLKSSSDMNSQKLAPRFPPPSLASGAAWNIFWLANASVTGLSFHLPR